MIETDKGIAFLNDIEEVCRKHGISISHEDFQGAFLLVPFEILILNWLREANYGKYAQLEES